MMKKNMKGQAAMEYLMTYGWAILAIVIVIAALIWLNPFGAPEMCLFQQQGLSCSEPPPQMYLDGDGDLFMNVRIENKLGKKVDIQEMVCTDAQVSDMEEGYGIQYSDISIPTGTYYNFYDTEAVPCVDANGDELDGFAPNQEFRGRLIVWYNFADDIDPDIKHQAQANVVSIVVEQ